jgi:hypothetical protein
MATMATSATKTTTGESVLLQVSVADLVVDYPTSCTATSFIASPLRDIEIAEIHADSPCLVSILLPPPLRRWILSGSTTLSNLNHSLQFGPRKTRLYDFAAEIHNGLFCSRFFYVLSCQLLLILIVAIFFAVEVLQDDQP